MVKVTLGIKFDREMGMGQSLSLPYCGEETSSYAILGYHPGAEKLATCSVVSFFWSCFREQPTTHGFARCVTASSMSWIRRLRPFGNGDLGDFFPGDGCDGYPYSG